VIKEVVVHETGLLIPLEQPETTAPFEPVDLINFFTRPSRRLSPLWQIRDFRAHGGSQSQTREDHFDWKAIAQQTAELYSLLIA
jgi:hypothetical protein